MELATDEAKLAPAVAAAGTLAIDRFVLVDVGCSGGIDPLWRVLGDDLQVHALDPQVDEIERLRRSENRSGRRVPRRVRRPRRRPSPGASSPRRLAIGRACRRARRPRGVPPKPVPDRAVELLLRHRDELTPIVDVDASLDLLAPRLDGEQLRHREYLAAFDGDPSRFLPQHAPPKRPRRRLLRS